MRLTLSKSYSIIKKDMINLPLVSAGLLSFVICILLIPVLIKLSNKNHWFDAIDERKIHKGNISRLAGIAIFISMTAGLVISFILLKITTGNSLNVPPGRFVSFFVAFLIVHLIGLIDDFKTIRPRYKFIVQIIAAVIIIVPSRSFSVLYIPFIGVNLNIGFAGYLLTAIWIIGACNAVNLIDGMDGLSGGITSIAALCIALVSIALGNTATAVIAFALFGSLIGFLVFNFPPAKIFMGDSGSLFIGFTLASLPLFEINYHSGMSLIIAITVLFIPVIDTLTSMLRRIKRHKSPFNPDREHIHHKLMNRNFSIKQILLTLYSASGILCIILTVWAFTGKSFFISILMVLWIILIIISLLLEKKNAEKA